MKALFLLGLTLSFVANVKEINAEHICFLEILSESGGHYAAACFIVHSFINKT